MSLLMGQSRRRTGRAQLAVAACLLALASSVQAFCFDEAAARYGVNPYVLRGIAFVESGFRADSVSRNTDGSIDYGAMQINSVHLGELKRFGIAPAQLMVPCTNVMVAAYLYRKKIDRYGNSWLAVGAYHSETPEYRDAYWPKVKAAVDGWVGVVR
ncbi:lytic transglycosylase domain-containing protein [Cupriavidus sp. D39]|uniref:lytic transglycosylase domain-containing protein n=1 Tax=Cupriavidus sp. D39 TaxID=2997877 RepID=UPI00226F7B3F|nr:lytic transglycosylase domain-containing protein [Cupriavidus sp. D39]MCY0853655.1 lytic transglycosylase domain-containing protein [Cupriavidus sp. D39]